MGMCEGGGGWGVREGGSVAYTEPGRLCSRCAEIWPWP